MDPETAKRIVRGQAWLALWHALIRDDLLALGVSPSLVEALDYPLDGLVETYELLVRVDAAGRAAVERLGGDTTPSA